MAPETVQAAVEPDEDLARARRKLAFEAADAEGLLGPRDTAVGGRVPSKLLAAARARSGAASTSELPSRSRRVPGASNPSSSSTSIKCRMKSPCPSSKYLMRVTCSPY